MYTRSIQQKVNNIYTFRGMKGIEATLMECISWPNLDTPLDAVAIQCFLADHRREATELYARIKRQ